MHYNYEMLGRVIKSARIRNQFTAEELAVKVDVTERYIYRIENDQKIPSFNVLFSLIRELNISPDLIFYPEKDCKENEMDDVIRMLYKCNDKSMAVIRVAVKALLENQE